MRSLLLVALVSACAARQTAWTTVDPPDVPDESEVFVIVGGTALHLAHVETIDRSVHGRVVHAWALPRAGVTAIADVSRTTTPEEIARGAGWPELQLGARRVQIPFDQISSVRATVDVVPDEEPQPTAGPPLLVVAAVSILDALVTPRCYCCH